MPKQAGHSPRSGSEALGWKVGAEVKASRLRRACLRRRKFQACSSGSYDPSVLAAGLGREGRQGSWERPRSGRRWPSAAGKSWESSPLLFSWISALSPPACPHPQHTNTHTPQHTHTTHTHTYPPPTHTHTCTTLGWILVSDWGQDPGSGLGEWQVWLSIRSRQGASVVFIWETQMLTQGASHH